MSRALSSSPLALATCILACSAWSCADSTFFSPPTVEADLANYPVSMDFGVPDTGSFTRDGAGVSTRTEGACAGYTLLAAPAPNASASQVVTLVDMDGHVVHRWNLWAMPPLMIPGGAVIGARSQRKIAAHVLQDAIDITQVAWDGNIEWTYSGWDDDCTGVMMARQHHDLQREGSTVGYWAPGQAPLARGKTLVLGHTTRLVLEVSDRMLTDDVFYELDANGQQTGWQWRAADHVEEMGFDADARAAIRKNPGWDMTRQTGDWLHINSLSRLGRNRWFEQQGDHRFHPENLIFSSRAANFIAIVDHVSGEIVWRVGPDMSAGKPGAELGQFVGQHHAHMIPHGLPGAGNILLFDNGGQSGYGGPRGYPRNTRSWSRVLEFNPVSLRKVWQYGADTSESPEYFFSYMIGGAQRLPNGNTLITDGVPGHIFEVTREKRIVWSYRSPFTDKYGSPLVYRAYRVPPEWIPVKAEKGHYTTWRTLYAE